MRTLLVHGDPVTTGSLAAGLSRHGYQLDTVNTGPAAWHNADLVIVDLDRSVHDGLELCRRIQAAGDLPIIALSGLGTEAVRVRGLLAGADDCVDKPVGSRELVARIEAVLRRSPARRQHLRMLRRGALSLDRRIREVQLSGVFVDLTDKEFDLLWLLASRSGAVVSREEIMARVWDDTWNRRGRIIDTYVSSVRGKLGQASWITTIRGVGFRFGQ